jgi:nicotinamidase/pyrazinamidase
VSCARIRGSSVSGSRILWDVDTQVDFVQPGGKLVVPGADATIPAMARLVAWARRSAIVHVASADDHELTDPEISAVPDFASTYPAHCLRGTRGAQRIAETEQVDPVVLSHIAYPPTLVGELVEGRSEILLLKKSFDVFTNPNAEAVLDALDPSEVIVFGVATDVCDHAAIVGLLSRGRRVAFVEDAARGLDEERTRACLEEWRAAGVRFTTSAAVAAAV